MLGLALPSPRIAEEVRLPSPRIDEESPEAPILDDKKIIKGSKAPFVVLGEFHLLLLLANLYDEEP